MVRNSLKHNPNDGLSSNGKQTYLQESCQVIRQISQFTLSHSKDVGEGPGNAPVHIHSGPDKENHSKIYRLILYPNSQKGWERHASSESTASLQGSQMIIFRSHGMSCSLSLTHLTTAGEPTSCRGGALHLYKTVASTS